jgi:predicted transglutaminase-like cysteine proteinase
VLFLWLSPCVLWAVMGQVMDRDRLRAEAEHRYGPAGLEAVSDWLKLIELGREQPVDERLERANQFINSRTMFESDFQVWQAQDYWATPLETLGIGRGDCEDFAIAKFVSLVALGIPQDQLRLIYVRAQMDGGRSQAHMVLGYYPDPNGEPRILDNLVGTIERASSRPDLVPVFSFNAEGLWAGGMKAANDPTARLSRWRDLMMRLRDEGIG